MKASVKLSTRMVTVAASTGSSAITGDRRRKQ
jgi:hypothetical protein